jgi:hypothetical protein
VIKSYEIGGVCSTHGEMRNAYKILFGKPEGKRLLRRAMRRWKDNIRMDLREVEFEVLD